MAECLTRADFETIRAYLRAAAEEGQAVAMEIAEGEEGARYALLRLSEQVLEINCRAEIYVAISEEGDLLAEDPDLEGLLKTVLPAAGLGNA